ncbi:MAG TPA: Cof-type HAD-IIB family hydrolase [Myxococcota bacterium]
MAFLSRGYRIALFDLDGTLLTTERKIRAENASALRRLVDAGVHVAICTGRSPRSAKQYIELLELVDGKTPHVHFNGAMVREGGGRMVHERTLAPDVALRALTASDGRILHANVYVGDEICIERASATSRESEVKDGVTHVLLEDLRARIRSGAAPVTKIMLIAEAASIPRLTSVIADAVADGAALVNSEPAYLEVLPPSCSKKTAAEVLAADLGLTLADVMFFGDNLNDLDLLLACGCGVAMANAHPDVLALISRQIGDNDSDAIARFLDQFDVDTGALVPRTA